MKLKTKIIIIASAIVITLASLCFLFRDNLQDLYHSITKEVDKSGFYTVDGYTVEALKQVDEKSVARFTKKLLTIKDQYLTEDNNAYFALVPDKSFYLKDKGYEKANYDDMIATLNGDLVGITSIDLLDTLTISDYYKTDGHWRQERLAPVVKRLSEEMEFTVSADGFTETAFDNFVGSYAKYIKGKTPVENLVYLENDFTKTAIVDNMQFPDVKTVYDTAKLTTKTPYDVFLSGVSPLITISNPNSTSKKELVLFRDSFGSSIAPLLLEGYKKVTLIDLRFLSTSMIKDYVTFDNQDVLFLYCTNIVNRSALLK